MKFEEQEECNCQGPGAQCNVCYAFNDKAIEELYSTTDTSSWSQDTPTVQIKALWLETVTENAALFLTKKGMIWIPVGMMDSFRKTKKGRYKINVYPSFKTTYINANHRYFKEPK